MSEVPFGRRQRSLHYRPAEQAMIRERAPASATTADIKRQEWPFDPNRRPAMEGTMTDKERADEAEAALPSIADRINRRAECSDSYVLGQVREIVRKGFFRSLLDQPSLNIAPPSSASNSVVRSEVTNPASDGRVVMIHEGSS